MDINTLDPTIHLIKFKYDKDTGEILEIYDKQAGATDAIAMQHDVEYSVCKDEIKRKMKQTKCCGKTEENNKTENVGTAHSSWLHDSTQYTDILLHNIDKIQQQKTFKN